MSKENIAALNEYKTKIMTGGSLLEGTVTVFDEFDITKRENLFKRIKTKIYKIWY
jgi:hypothetical protein